MSVKDLERQLSSLQNKKGMIENTSKKLIRKYDEGRTEVKRSEAKLENSGATRLLRW